MELKNVNGDLLKLAKEGHFDVITHGCNCECTMGSGIAKQIKEQFPEAYKVDCKTIKGDFNKLGNFTFVDVNGINGNSFRIINSYTQYRYGVDKIQIDYEALTLCMRKINHFYNNIRIGLPLIGAGLAGGDWNIIKNIIEREFTKNIVTIVHFKN
jgi:O-acetyl-ADP-ribose deacetylase (regulator of RNase III)